MSHMSFEKRSFKNLNLLAHRFSKKRTNLMVSAKKIFINSKKAVKFSRAELLKSSTICKQLEKFPKKNSEKYHLNGGYTKTWTCIRNFLP